MKIAHSFALFALVLSLFTGCNNKSANTIAYIDFSDFWDYSATNSNQMVQMWDQLHTTATLQGVVNRHSPKIYINYVKNEMMEADRF